MMSRNTVLGVLSIMYLIPTIASAQSDLRLLGQTSLNFRGENEIIHVGSCSGAQDKVSAVKIEVLQNDVELDYLALRFGNGETQELRLREQFRANTTSRKIDLEGNKRCVESIQIIGRTTGSGRKAIVRIMAVEDGRSDYPGTRGFTIAETSLRKRDVHRTVYAHEGCSGRFSRDVQAVQIEVSRAAAEIDYIAVTFGNGRTQELDIRELFAAGSRSRIIDLKGASRCVESFQISGRSIGRNARALVKLIGY